MHFLVGARIDGMGEGSSVVLSAVIDRVPTVMENLEERNFTISFSRSGKVMELVKSLKVLEKSRKFCRV